MIENLTRITITGPAKDFDRVIFQYLSGYTIDYEAPPVQAKRCSDSLSLEQDNPYTEAVKLGDLLISYLDTNQPGLNKMEIADARQILISLNSKVTKLLTNIDIIKQTIANHILLLHQLEPFLDSKCNLSSIEKLQYLNETHEFQREPLPRIYDQTPHSIYMQVQDEIKMQNESLERQTQTLLSILYAKRLDILSAYQTVTYYKKYYDIRNYVTFFDNSNPDGDCYKLTGYIPTKEIGHLSLDLKSDSSIHALFEIADPSDHKVPTKLKNPSFLQPFEQLTKSTGLPTYQEIDPTIFVALSFGILFGLLLGDTLQGIFLMVFGYLLYHYQKINTAGTLCFAGLFSISFGILTGRFGGWFEASWFPTLIIRPTKQAVPILLTSTVFGIILLILALLSNIIHRFRGYNPFRPNWILGILYLILIVLSLSATSFFKIGLTQLLYHLTRHVQENTGFIMFILGNLLICGLIGLLATILILRLLYQFMLCFIHSGTGIEFKPH